MICLLRFKLIVSCVSKCLTIPRVVIVLKSYSSVIKITDRRAKKNCFLRRFRGEGATRATQFTLQLPCQPLFHSSFGKLRFWLIGTERPVFQHISYSFSSSGSHHFVKTASAQTINCNSTSSRQEQMIATREEL